MQYRLYSIGVWNWGYGNSCTPGTSQHKLHVCEVEEPCLEPPRYMCITLANTNSIIYHAPKTYIRQSGGIHMLAANSCQNTALAIQSDCKSLSHVYPIELITDHCSSKRLKLQPLVIKGGVKCLGPSSVFSASTHSSASCCP